MEEDRIEQNKAEHEAEEDKQGITHAKHSLKHHKLRKEKTVTMPMILLMIMAALLLLFNQFQINSISSLMGYGFSSITSLNLGSGSKGAELKMSLDEIKSTGHTLAAVFPVEDIKTQDDAMAILFPTGIPEYGAELEVSFDDPVGSLAKLSRMYPALRVEVMQNNPEGWQKFMNLASRPLGISCEYCCGVGPMGIRKDGTSACGCQHNPALLAIALYLSAYTDYSDGEILREVMKWKTLFFPQKMIELGMTVAGGDVSKLEKLPGMVGGC